MKVKEFSIKIYNLLRQKKARPYIIIFVVGWLLLFPSLFYDYHFLDDNVLIKDNLYRLEKFSFLPQAFTEGAFHSPNGAELYYRPILTLSFWLDTQIGGGQLWFYHLTDILLHIIVAWLIYITLLKLKLSHNLSFVFALLFLVHPINLQAIAWLPGRNDPLLAIFVLAAFIYFLRWLENNKPKDWWLIWLFYILALLTKETAIVLPMILFLYLILINKVKIFSKNNLLFFGYYLLITIPWWILRSSVIQEKLSDNYNIFTSLWANWLGIIPYIGKIFLPFNLSTFPILNDMPLIYGLLSITILTLAIFYSKGKNWSWLLFGLAWFGGFLLPSLIRPLSSLADFSEHRIYLPLVGFIIFISAIKLNLNLSKKTLKTIFVTIATIFIIINITHAKVYKNKTTFWKNAVDYSPSSSFNHNNLGAMYYLDGQYDKAVKQWETTLKLNPDEPLTHNNLGLLYAAAGQFEQAQKMYLRELDINPNYDNAHFNLGILYYNNNNTEGALQLWEKTIQINSSYADAYLYLAAHYYKNNELDKAKKFAQEYVNLGGQLPSELKSILN